MNFQGLEWVIAEWVELEINTTGHEKYSTSTQGVHDRVGV